MRHIPLGLTVILASASLFMSACGSSEGLFGRELYERSCQTCHRADGSGGTGKAIGPGSEAVDLTDEQIAGVIRAGPGVMPSFTRLTDEQVASLVSYVRELQGPGG
jgi:mono/diheme cytochrome c family protein